MRKISIVTPSYNQARFLAECLLSVKKQGYPIVEHIVVDGGSTDGSIALLKEYSSREGWSHLRWVSEPDRGASDALNKGFRMVTGEIVGWLNSDDRYRPGCFHLIEKTFQVRKEIDIVYGDYTWMNESGRVWRIRRECAFNPFVLLYHRVLVIPATATFFRRKIFDDGNFFNIDFHYAMDSEFFCRLMSKGYRFHHVRGLLADYRWHSDSKSTVGQGKQIEEHDRTVEIYSLILRNLPLGPIRKSALFVLRGTAGICRYSEKLLRGYYFEQFRAPSSFTGA